MFVSAALLLASCGGGSGYMAPVTNTAPVVNTGTNTGSAPASPVLHDYSRSTGLTGTVGIPAPASFGATPPPAQIATPDGPTFTSGPYPANVSFPALTTTLQSTVNGLTAGPANESASVGLLGTPATGTSLQLIVPGVNLNQTFPLNLQNGVVEAPLSPTYYDYGNVITFGLSYVALGGWGQWGWGDAKPENPLQSSGVFAFGYETPGSAVPASGAAVFNGVSLATVFTPAGTDIRATDAIANAAFSVDFASGKVTGAFTHSTYLGVGSWLPWNDVSLTASIATGTNKFTGTTAVTSAPQGTFTLNSSATGSINGGFYGPAAQNLGAVWTLSDGTTSAVGGVAAGRSASGP